MIPKSATGGAITQSAAKLIGLEPAVRSRTRQHWVLDPFQDAVLIIFAPLITLALALLAIRFWGASDGITLVLLVHVVFTVAHHLPTFIRIYGDVELFRRFRWSFVFAPLIVFSCAFGITVYLNLKGYPLERFLFLYIILTLWDPWHFMRQHYGFMRIYDRGNAASGETAARLDLALAASWFAFILLASGDWLLDLLQDMYTRVHWPVLLAITGGGLSFATGVLRNLALLVSAIYVCHLCWRWSKGYFVSRAKVLLCAVTFGVMYLTYTPNALMQSLAPGWSFRAGFAVIGVVHMTQYLAIVWRYNRGLAARPGRARAGVFRWLHSRGAWWAAGGYVVLCLCYGEVITTVRQNEWLMGTLLALGFTSTMMHYYFDGFIWKVRHQQNREALDAVSPLLSSTAAPAHTVSWWASARRHSPSLVLARQLLYFAAPMTVLAAAAFAVNAGGDASSASGDYIDHMYQAQTLSSQGLGDLAEREARAAFGAMRAELPLARKRTELQPSASREAELALLIYNESLYENVVVPALNGHQAGEKQLSRHREHVREAANLMSHAILSGGSLAHAGRTQFTVADANRVLASWRKQVG